MTERDELTAEIETAADAAADETRADATQEAQPEQEEAPVETPASAAQETDGRSPTEAGPRFAGLDLAELVAPIAPDDPCGPDLDLEGDLDFMNYMARAEGLLPASYFSFDRNGLDLPAEIAAGAELSKRTRNVQLLALLAKFSILNRDLKGYARRIAAIAELLEARWDDVHPRPLRGGSFVPHGGGAVARRSRPLGAAAPACAAVPLRPTGNGLLPRPSRRLGRADAARRARNIPTPARSTRR
jgi:hypothetical protein